MLKIKDYLERVGEPYLSFYENIKGEFNRKCPSHPGSQKKEGGLGIHTLQVIEKALELNQGLDEKDIIITAFMHDLIKTLPLTSCQQMAIDATKGKVTYKGWRKSGCDKLVVLILIADMWSAFINIDNNGR